VIETEPFCCPLTQRALSFREVDGESPSATWQSVSERHGLGAIVGTLITAEGDIAYPVWKDIIGLLPEFAVSRNADVNSTTLDATKRSVARFYDDFGWRGADDETEFFNDALAFEDLRPLTAFYRHRCHRRVNRVLGSGKWLLDVASGAVQIPEYVSFSEHFDKRICVDISITGLLQAKRRLGEHAICVAGDITALPIRSDSVDGFVSVHTIYHVPADQQATAVAHLHRALRPGAQGAIVYSWGSRAPIYRLIDRLQRWFPRPLPPASAAAPPMDLYFSPQDMDWYRREVAAKYPTRSRVWRSLEKASLEYFARGRLSAAIFLWPLYALEQLLPGVFGRLGICPMFVIRKAARKAA
jgi:hypothetical protein